MGGPIRLDIGCGHKSDPGWVRIDFDVARKKATFKFGVSETDKALSPDVVSDVMKLPFPDNYADEARAIHVIEHMHVWRGVEAITEWVRVLKPGAMLAIECPCLDKIVKLFDVPNIPPYMTYWGLFGDPRLKDPLMMHHWCYTEQQLNRFMQAAGLVDIRGEPPQFHQASRDMRLIGFKPAAEDAPRIVIPDRD